MPTTTLYGLRYPSPDDAPDVPLAMQRLAEDVESKAAGRTSVGPKRMHLQTMASADTDANGYRTFAHSAGFTPRAVFLVNITPGSSFAIPWGTDAYQAASFRGRFANAAGDGALASLPTGTLLALLIE